MIAKERPPVLAAYFIQDERVFLPRQDNDLYALLDEFAQLL